MVFYRNQDSTKYTVSTPKTADKPEAEKEKQSFVRDQQDDEKHVIDPLPEGWISRFDEGLGRYVYHYWDIENNNTIFQYERPRYIPPGTNIFSHDRLALIERIIADLQKEREQITVADTISPDDKQAKQLGTEISNRLMGAQASSQTEEVSAGVIGERLYQVRLSNSTLYLRSEYSHETRTCDAMSIFYASMPARMEGVIDAPDWLAKPCVYFNRQLTALVKHIAELVDNHYRFTCTKGTSTTPSAVVVEDAIRCLFRGSFSSDPSLTDEKYDVEQLVANQVAELLTRFIANNDKCVETHLRKELETFWKESFVLDPKRPNTSSRSSICFKKLNQDRHQAKLLVLQSIPVLMKPRKLKPMAP